MKKALYINIGGEGHVNPTLGFHHEKRAKILKLEPGSPL